MSRFLFFYPLSVKTLQVEGNRVHDMTSTVPWEEFLSAVRTCLDPVYRGPPRVFCCSGPTGCGKTRSVLDLLRNESHLRTLFLFPTRIAKIPFLPSGGRSSSTFGPMTLMTFHHAFSTFIKCNVTFWSSFEVICIDECHCVHDPHVEIILQVLARHRPRLLLFISATPPLQLLESLFSLPPSSFESSDMIPPSPPLVHSSMERDSPFPVTDEFVWKPSWGKNGPLNLTMMYQCMVHLLEDVHQHTPSRVSPGKVTLVFCSTQQDCDLLASMTQKKYPDLSVDVLYSQRYDSLTEVTTTQTSHHLFFCTNWVESSVTIPNVQWVIDFGAYFQPDGFGGHIKYCGKTSLLQRRGRTGRTCPGTYSLVMPQSSYSSLPDVRASSFSNKHRCFTQMIAYGISPLPYFPNHETCISSIQEEFKGEPFWFRKWLCECPMQPGLAKLVFHMVGGARGKHKEDATTTGQWLLASTVLSMMVTHSPQRVNILYLPKGYHNNKNGLRTVMEQQWKEIFGSWSCAWQWLVSIFLSIFLQEKPKEYCRFMSVNYRTYRSWVQLFTRSCRHFGVSSSVLRDRWRSSSWTESKESTVVCTISCFPRVTSRLETVCTIDSVLKIPVTHWKDFSPQYNAPFCRVTISVDFWRQIDRDLLHRSDYPLIYDTVDGILDHSLRTDRKEHAILSDPYGPVALVPLQPSRPILSHLVELRSENNMIVATPLSSILLRQHMTFLRRHIRKWCKHTSEKTKWKEEFCAVVREINEEVAYRPGMVHFTSARDHFYSVVR